MSIIKYLFETNAIQVANEGEIFLTTSGLVTPYYVNTHFLCGGEKESVRLLSLIDSFKTQPTKIVTEVSEEIIKVYDNNSIYKEVINLLVDVVKNQSNAGDLTCVSGGERRDWFFSVPLARKLGLPHLYVYNDGLILDDSANLYCDSNPVKTIHAADLLTVGSSYTSKWVPYLLKKDVQIGLSLNCVDRDQGGVKNLLDSGVTNVENLCKIDESFFIEAKNAGVLSRKQLDGLLMFFKDQTASMRDYLITHPQVIKKLLSSDEKTKKRITITLKEDLYQLGSDFLSQFEKDLFE